ncbi:hypothetical protein ACFW08_36915 [Streptomyces sp. NPDC058960]|uniref:hypothetical protein n=1 Tax=Streptomyces sp. NPDC058960 TaxID=3346679 RepID=UPI0036C1E00D
MTNTSKPPEGAGSLVYQCRLPLFTNTVNYVAAGQIAVLLLAVLRHDQRAADLAGGNDISATTIRRWCDEVIALLAAKAPRLNRGLKKISRGGGEVVLLNGTPIRTRRRTGKANRKNYSGKHKSHGLMFLALTDERGNLAWIPSARRGTASEVKTARHDKICEHLRIAGLIRTPTTR